jgi:hypothetical protein
MRIAEQMDGQFVSTVQHIYTSLAKHCPRPSCPLPTNAINIRHPALALVVSHSRCLRCLRLSPLLVPHPPRNLLPLIFSSQQNPRSLVCRSLRLLAHNTRTPPGEMQDHPETIRSLRPRSPRRTQ